MSARLKLKRMQSQIKGFQKQAEIAEYERYRIIELFMKNTERYVIKASVEQYPLNHDTGHYIDYLTHKLAHVLLDKFGENLAEYIRLNFNLSDIGNHPLNVIEVELVAPKLNEKHVTIKTCKKFITGEN